MYPRQFEYLVARSLAEACDLLVQYGEDGRVLAGGQSLIPLMKLRLASPSHLIDITQIAELSGITANDGELRIGALTTHAAVLENETVRQGWPLIADAVNVIADTQVRNWGTVGGALAEADPAGDWGAVAIALKARVRCFSKRGVRWVNAENLFVDAYTPAVASDELITEVIFPKPKQPQAGAYLKLERRAGDFAIVSCGVQLEIHKEVCQEARIALAAAGLTPLFARAASAFLQGKKLTPETIDDAARQVAAATSPLADIRGSEDFKRAAAATLFKDAINIAMRRAAGEHVEVGHGR